MTTLEPGPDRLARTKTDSIDSTDDPVTLFLNRPTRRVPRYSEEYVDYLRRVLYEDRERELEQYAYRVAQAHFAIRMALRSLEHGDVERAVRELRRGGALSIEELQET